MKWSEDRSEVTLTAAEFAAQSAAIAAAKTRSLAAENHARECDELLNEATKKDVALRRTTELKECVDLSTHAQATVISAAQDFFAEMMNAFFYSHTSHPTGCPCHICDKDTNLRSMLEARSKKVYNGNPPYFKVESHCDKCGAKLNDITK